MGFYVRTSLRAGPFRLNLSRSGVGVSAGVPGFRVGAGPRGNYVTVGAAGIRYRATLPRSGRPAGRKTSAAPGPLAADAGVVMHDTTGENALTLAPTGPGDLVAQLNEAGQRRRRWPWLLTGLLVLIAVTAPALPLSVPLLLATPFIVVWYALSERAKRTVVTFYQVDGPTATWYEQVANGFAELGSLGGAWRIQESGAIDSTHQYKVNSGASTLVRRSATVFTVTPPRTLTTNISVPSLTCGKDSLLFLPDRILVRSDRSWSDLTYDTLQITSTSTRFIETDRVPHDGEQVGTTWRYVNVKGGPDRRFKDNPQLPIMRYGRLEITSPGGLRWIVDCSRVDAATWVASVLSRPVLPAISAAVDSTQAVSAPVVPPPIVPSPSAAVPRVTALPPVVTPARAATSSSGFAPTRAPQTRFATPGRHGPLFGYADHLHRKRSLAVHDGPFAVIDVETTGFSPHTGDRIIEIAIARVDRHGRVEDEFATLIDPDGRDTGAVFVHGISNDAVRGAPRFADIAADIVARMDGCVLVAHNASFEERFLDAEFARAGLSTGPMPALCTLWLAQETMPTPNHKLATLARHVGISMPDAHAALGDVRAVVALLPHLLGRTTGPIGYPCPPMSARAVRTSTPGRVALRTRAVGLRRGTDGWMSSILARLPMSAGDVGDAGAERYLSLLADVLSDGRIVGDEACALADLAGRAGLGSVQVVALNQRFLESMREAAFEDDTLTTKELTGLHTAATALGVPEYFDDLVSDDDPAGVHGLHAAPVAQAPRQRRCGHCQTPGHYRSTCPDLLITN